MDRRNVIKGGAGIVFGTTIVSGLAQDANAGQSNEFLYADEEAPVTETAHREEEYDYSQFPEVNQWYRVESTVRTAGGYEDRDNNWQTDFQLAGYGVARRYEVDNETPKDGDKVDVLDEHTIKWSNQDDGELFIATDKKLGGWPAPKYTAMEFAEDFVEQIMEIPMDSLGQAADLILQPIETYEELSSEYNKNTSDPSGPERTYSWYYGDGWTSDQHSDVGHFMEFIHEQDLNTTNYIYVENGIKDGAVYPQVNWEIRIDSPGQSGVQSIETTTGSSSQQNDSVAENMTEGERKEWGMKKVPLDVLENAGVTLRNPKIVDGDKVWFATSPKVSINPTNAEETSN